MSISPDTNKALEAFASKVTWQGAGSEADQERLLDFIIAAYRHGDHAIDQEEFLDAVNAFDRERSAETTTPAQKKRSVAYKLYTFHKYEEGVRLLKKFDTPISHTA